MKRAIAAIVSACIGAGAQAASWVVIGTDPNGEMAIDMDSVVPGERFVDAVTRYSQKSPSMVGGKEYVASITAARFDCKHGAYAARTVSYFDDSRPQRSLVYIEQTPEGELRYLFPAKNSHGEEAMRVACEKGRAK